MERTELIEIQDIIEKTVFCELNNEKTRNNLLKILKTGFPNRNFKCDEETNTPEIVNNNEFVVMVEIDGKWNNLWFKWQPVEFEVA